MMCWIASLFLFASSWIGEAADEASWIGEAADVLEQATPPLDSKVRNSRHWIGHEQEDWGDHSRCGHGHMGPHGCICDPGWRHSGPTDPPNFFKGRCAQYECESDEVCSRELSRDGLIVKATCDVPGWNCKCDWNHADYFLGGYETQGAKCMGMLYNVSDALTRFAWFWISWAWKVFAVFAAFALPFGEKQVRCECQQPRMCRVAKSVKEAFCEHSHPCHGECMQRPRWNFRFDIWFDLAWSIYVIDIGIWFYAFIVAILLTGLIIGSILAIAFLVIMLIIGCALLLMGAAGEGGGCCDCEGFGGFDAGGFDAGFSGNAGVQAETNFAMEEFWIGGPTINAPDGTGGDCSCCDCPRCWLCRPMAWVLVRFPHKPANLWGGALGYYCLGTHQFTSTERRYAGGNRWIDSLSFRSGQDLHDRDDWRRSVHEFVFGGAINQVTSQAAIGSAQQRPAQQPLRGQIAGVRITEIDREFKKDLDNCQASTFEDYKKPPHGECWVCYSQEPQDWDMWVQCGHMFCKKCSEQMLQRRMPCPLCRVVSFSVKRGKGIDESSPDVTQQSMQVTRSRGHTV